MEPKIEGISRKIWHIVRVTMFMIKKGICKKKLLMDLNMMMKSGKVAGKALGSLMFHNNNRFFASQGGINEAREYEFSCSNTPLYRHYFTNKRKNNHRTRNIEPFYMPSPYPLEDYNENDVSLEDVNNILEMMLRNEEVGGGISAPSPISLGFGRSPAVRQLRITDSPFPVRNMDQDDKQVDQAAEDFIKKFYSQLKMQT